MKPEEFEARMKEAAKEITQARPLMQRVADVEAEEARSRAPERTGFLRDHVYSQATNDTATVGDSAPYAGFVHDGTRFMRAQPFIREAVDATVGEVESLAQQFGEEVFARVGG